MMKSGFYLFAIVITTVYLSCSKSAQQDSAPSPIPPIDSPVIVLKSGLLIKELITGTAPQDSTVVLFDYDKESRLVSRSSIFYQNSTAPGTIKYAGYHYYRDGNGRIIKVASKYLSDLPTTIDTFYSTVQYQDATTGKVAYALEKHEDNGKMVYDSVVYTYDANDRVIKIAPYYSNNWPTNAATSNSYETWEYNIDADPVKYELRQILSTPGQFDLIFSYDFTYDDKTNPLFAKDDVRISQEWAHMKRNFTQQRVHENIAQQTYDNIITYQYDTDNKPASSIQTGNYPNNTKYYYSK